MVLLLFGSDFNSLQLSLSFDFLEEFRTHANLVRKPTPWVYGDQPLSESELEEMRNEFWQNVIRAGGRPGTFRNKLCKRKGKP